MLLVIRSYVKSDTTSGQCSHSSFRPESAGHLLPLKLFKILNSKFQINFIINIKTHEFSTPEMLAHTKTQANELLAPSLLYSIVQSKQFDVSTANMILVEFSTAMEMENFERRQSAKPRIEHSKPVRIVDRLHRLLRRAVPVILHL